MSSKTQSPQSYLWTSVVRSHLGENGAAVVLALISYGRLSTRDLAERTALPAKVIKTTLVLLIQMNCIQYWKDERAVFYQLDERGILVLLHSGDIVHHIKATYGEASAAVMQNILENGHMRVEDYLSTIEDAQAVLDTQDIFHKLYTHGWLERLQLHDLSPVDDLWDKLYQETIKATPRSATTSEIKRVQEATERTKVKFAATISQGTSSRDVFFTEAGAQRLQPHIVVRASLDRWYKHLRTGALVALARSRVGELLARVYEAALTSIEKNSPATYHALLRVSGLINDPEQLRSYLAAEENTLVDNKKITFNVRDLAAQLPREVDLRNTILTHNFLKPKRPLDIDHDLPTKKVKLEDLAVLVTREDEVDDFLDITDNSESHSVSLVQHHLKLLSEGQVPFLIETSAGVYSVPYLSLTKHLKECNYDLLIKTTLGASSLRVLRCLKSLKLADEKTLSNSVLLKEKNVRNEIYRLVNMNVVEIQDVPRSADRAASKTFYLFRHKPFAAYASLANSLLYNMAELLANIEGFKQDNKILLEKCERIDVQGHEEELLLESELKTLRDLQVREVTNMVRFNRIKTLYTVFGVL